MITHYLAIAILAIVLICIVILFIRMLIHEESGGNLTKYITTERFDAVRKLRQTQSKVDTMDGRDLEECPSNAGFEQMCKYHRSCCQDNAVGSSGCLCNDPILSRCRSEYDECRKGKGDAAMSNIGAEFVGAKAARGDMCQSILDNCCSAGSQVYDKMLAKGGDTMSSISGMKPVVGTDSITNGQGPICSHITESREACRNSCAANPKCHVAYRDELAGLCELYESNTIKKKNTNEMMADNNFRMWTKGNVTELPPDILEGFLSESDENRTNGRDMASRCFNSIKVDGSGNGSGNGCQHPVITECKRLRKQCIDNYSELLGDAKARDMCIANHNACCQTLQNINLGERFALDGPIFGKVSSDTVGSNKGDRSDSDRNSWKCDISKDVKSLSECQKRCLEDPRCQILDSNMSLFNGINGLNLAKLPSARCVMYNNNYNIATGSNVGKPKKIGQIGSGLQTRVIYEPKNIWHRQIKDELDALDDLNS